MSLSGCRSARSDGSALNTPTCGPYHLYAEQTTASAPHPCRSIRRWGVAATASTYVRAPASRARAHMAATSGAVPVTFDVAVTAIHRVRSDSTAAMCVGLESQRLPVGLGEANGGPGPLRCQYPGSDVAVVVEPGDHHLVARAEGSAHGPSEPHRERGHRLAEDDAVLLAAEKLSAHLTGRPHERIGGLGLGEGTVRVGGVARPPPGARGLYGVIDGLGAGRPIEPDPVVTEPREPLAIHPAMVAVAPTTGSASPRVVAGRGGVGPSPSVGGVPPNRAGGQRSGGTLPASLPRRSTDTPQRGVLPQGGSSVTAECGADRSHRPGTACAAARLPRCRPDGAGLKTTEFMLTSR